MPENPAIRRVSVVIPTRNRRDLLSRALQSVQQQILPQEVEIGEIIVVDDGSTDGTADWIAEAHPDVRVIARAVSGGAPAARNLGIAAAQGDFVAFLDSDDRFLPDKIARQVAAMDQTSAGFSTTGSIGSSGRTLYTGRATRDRLMRVNCLGGTSGLMARTEVLRRNPFDPAMPAVQDWELFLRLIRDEDFVHLPEPLYYYEMGQPDRITRHARRRFLGHARLWRLHIRGQRQSWRTTATHRAGLRMLAAQARGWPVRSAFWRVIWRVLVG